MFPRLKTRFEHGDDLCTFSAQVARSALLAEPSAQPRRDVPDGQIALSSREHLAGPSGVPIGAYAIDREKFRVGRDPRHSQISPPDSVRPRKISTSQRGYGSRHQQLRRQLSALVAPGDFPCARCGEPILKGQAWDLDHSDDRGTYLGPSHAACNRGAPSRKRTSVEVPRDDPDRQVFWGPDGQRWSRAWFDWRS